MSKEYEELSEKMADYWNTRIIKHTVGDETYYAIHEVYYDKQGKPVMWTEEPIKLQFEDPEEFAELINQILEANARPILELDEENKKLIEGEK